MSATKPPAARPGAERTTISIALPEREWQTVVWDDPVNLMSYVTFVFQEHFGFDRATAERYMLHVHQDGSAVVASGSREAMELHVEAMHGFGLWATVRQEGKS